MAQTNSSKISIRTLWIAIFLVCISYVTLPLIAIFHFGIPRNSAEFGDTFGIVNSLFSSLAFALLIYTSWMQKEELELQRKELQLSRIELKKSVEAQNRLAKLSNDQLRFEKNVRRSSIRPELNLSNGGRWKVATGQNYYRINLKVVVNRIRITRISMIKYHEENINKEFQLLYEPQDLLNKCLNPEESIILKIIHRENEMLSLNNISIKIQFSDPEYSGNYSQSIEIVKDQARLSDITDNSSMLDNLALS